VAPVSSAGKVAQEVEAARLVAGQLDNGAGRGGGAQSLDELGRFLPVHGRSLAARRRGR
jgi:hypothetical protein